MSPLPRRTIVTLAAALILLLLGLNLWIAPRLALKRSATSFGVERHGYKAAYDLLLELGVPVRRSYVRPSAAPTRGSLWFVLPSFLEPGESDTGADAAAGELLRWVRAGGRAVVFGGPDSDWKRLDIARAVAAGGGAASPDGAAASAGTGVELIEGDFAPRAQAGNSGPDALRARR